MLARLLSAFIAYSCCFPVRAQSPAPPALDIHGWPIVAEADLQQMMSNQMASARLLDVARNSLDFVQALADLASREALRSLAATLLGRAAAEVAEGVAATPPVSTLAHDPAAVTNYTRQYAEAFELGRSFREAAPVDPRGIAYDLSG